MAKIKWGMMVVDGRGKLGGHVLSKNRGGSVVRTKVTPSNARTVAQMNVRGIFSAISSAWSGLSAVARSSWNEATGSFATTNIFGDGVTPSGKALFQKLNQNLLLSGQAQLTNAPQPESVPFANLVGAELSIVGGTLDISTFGDTTGSKVLISCTPPLSQGTSNAKNRFRSLLTITGGNAIGVDVFSEYTAKYGSIVSGSNIQFGVKVINANGQASPTETVKMTQV